MYYLEEEEHDKEGLGAPKKKKKKESSDLQKGLGAGLQTLGGAVANAFPEGPVKLSSAPSGHFENANPLDPAQEKGAPPMLGAPAIAGMTAGNQALERPNYNFTAPPPTQGTAGDMPPPQQGPSAEPGHAPEAFSPSAGSSNSVVSQNAPNQAQKGDASLTRPRKVADQWVARVSGQPDEGQVKMDRERRYDKTHETDRKYGEGFGRQQVAPDRSPVTMPGRAPSQLDRMQDEEGARIRQYPKIKDKDLKEDRGWWGKFTRFLGEMGKSGAVGVYEAKLDPGDPNYLEKLIHSFTAGATAQAVDPAWDEKRTARRELGELQGLIGREQKIQADQAAAYKANLDNQLKEQDIQAKYIKNFFDNMYGEAARMAEDPRWQKILAAKRVTEEDVKYLNERYPGASRHMSVEDWNKVIIEYVNGWEFARREGSGQRVATGFPSPPGTGPVTVQDNRTGQTYTVSAKDAHATGARIEEGAANRHQRELDRKSREGIAKLNASRSIISSLLGPLLKGSGAGADAGKVSAARQAVTDYDGFLTEAQSELEIMERSLAKAAQTGSYEGVERVTTAEEVAAQRKRVLELQMKQKEAVRDLLEAEGGSMDPAAVRNIQKELQKIDEVINLGQFGINLGNASLPDVSPDYYKGHRYTRADLLAWAEQYPYFQKRGMSPQQIVDFFKRGGGVITDEGPPRLRRKPPRRQSIPWRP